ncbi:MAG: hypothetical protein WC658_02835, partial [Candidatus Omnitrophota bacterium]
MNLRPDSPDNIIDDYLAETEVGKILLEADLQLKKDTASATNPQTLEGKEYWNKLYKKAEELFGYENITIPTLTRPWIVPGEIIIRETPENAYIYKATLKVMLEQDYLKSPQSTVNSQQYNFSDPRLKVLNEYSSQLIRELIIPKITQAVNTAKRYAPLRQVYYSLILAQWFKSKYSPQSTVNSPQNSLYASLIDTRNLNGITAKEDYSKETYFKQYQDSFNKGEYKIEEPHYTPFGQTIRSYFSGGITFGGELGAAKEVVNPVNPTIPDTFRDEAEYTLPITVTSVNIGEVNSFSIGEKKQASLTDIALLEPNVSKAAAEPAHAQPSSTIAPVQTAEGIRALILRHSLAPNEAHIALVIEIAQAKKITDAQAILAEYGKLRSQTGALEFGLFIEAIKNSRLVKWIEGKLVKRQKSPTPFQKGKPKEEKKARKFLAGRMDINALKKDFQEIINTYGYLPFKELYLAVGENAWHLFSTGLPGVKHLITDRVSLNQIGDDLVRLGVVAGENAGNLFSTGLPAVKQLFSPEEFKAYWPRIVEKLESLCQSANNYNRARLLELFSKRYLPFIRENKLDFFLYLDFYTEIIRKEPRLCLQVLEGAYDAIEKGIISSSLPEQERQQILSFAQKYRSFSPSLFKLHKDEGEAGLQEVIAFAEGISLDQAGEQELSFLETVLRNKGITKEDELKEALIAAIQMAIPSSGASFVRKEEIQGLFAKFRQDGDKRQDIPPELRDKDFGDSRSIELVEYRLKSGEAYDPQGQIRSITDKLRYRDRGLVEADKQKKTEEDKAVFVVSLKEWFRDFSNPEKEASCFDKFLTWVSHNDALSEKIDAITGDYNGAVLLEHLFMDKDNLAVILREALKGVLQSELPEGEDTIDKLAMVNPKALLAQVNGIWRAGKLTDTEKETRLSAILGKFSFQEINANFLPFIQDAKLKAAILSLPRIKSRMSLADIIEEFFKEPLGIIQQEKVKFSPQKQGEVVLEFRVVKGIPYGLWGLNAGVCIATDIELWKNNKFMLLAIIDKNTHQAVGFVHLFVVEINGKRILTIPGIEPSVEFLSQVKAGQVYPLIEEALKRIAQEGNFTGLYIPTEPNVLSNRSDIAEIVRKKYASRKKTLSKEIKWNSLPQPYPFKEVYIVWERDASAQSYSLAQPTPPAAATVAKEAGLILPSTQARFGKLPALALGWVAAVWEVFHSTLPYSFLISHDRVTPARVIGAIVIWSAMAAGILFGLPLLGAVTSLSLPWAFALSAAVPNILTHGIYNTLAHIFNFAPLEINEETKSFPQRHTVPFNKFVSVLRNHIGKPSPGLYETIRSRILRGESPLSDDAPIGNVGNVETLSTFIEEHFAVPEEAVRETITNAYDSMHNEADPAKRIVDVKLANRFMSVQDHGSGMSLDIILKKLFPPFEGTKSNPVFTRINNIIEKNKENAIPLIQQFIAGINRGELSDIERLTLADIGNRLGDKRRDAGDRLRAVANMLTFTGRFGIGFYSLLYFLQSEGDSIDVVTSTGKEAYKIIFFWQDGEIKTAIELINPDMIERGTTVTLRNDGPKKTFDMINARKMIWQYLSFNANAKINLSVLGAAPDLINAQVFKPDIYEHIQNPATHVEVFYSKRDNDDDISSVFINVHGVT